MFPFNQTHENYLTQTEALTVKEMASIHQTILANANSQHEEFADYWHNLFHDATRYATIRAEWSQLSRKQKMEKDPKRTNSHNMIIDHFILLERLFIFHNWDSDEWTTQLFLQAPHHPRTRSDVQAHRQRIGDFANYLVFVSALNGR